MVFNESYDCIYSASGIVTDTYNQQCQVNIDVSHEACFSEIYSKIRGCKFADIIYRIYLYKDNIKNKNFNLCDKLETKKILRCLKKTVDFNYKFKKGTYVISKYDKKEVDYNILVVNIKGTFPQHLWLTTMLRCFFEYPYNIAAKEACELQSKRKIIDEVDLSKENWINLYLTIAAKLGSSSLHGVASLYNHPKAKTYNNWKKDISNIDSKGGIYVNITKTGGSFKNESLKVINVTAKNYNSDKEKRASKYVSAYKEKLSWK